MNETATDIPSQHPFVGAPNRTLIRLAVPVLFSLIAEPLTGLVDTIFVARLPGSEPTAALGIGTMLFASVFWAFNFLGVGTQTEVSQAIGRRDREYATKTVSLAIALGACVGVVLLLLSLLFLDGLPRLLGAQGDVAMFASEYMFWRFLGAPAVLISISCFGMFRGVQDMKTPFYVAVGVNLLNVLLDWLFIFGIGPIAPMGVAGAAIASSASQWVGALWCLAMVVGRLGITANLRGAAMSKLLKIGGDLFVRTGVLLLFVAYCTRVANAAGPDEGAAYQALRQFFIFSALFLDAFTITGQSLVGYFLGAEDSANARRVARIVCLWTIGTGFVMGGLMLAGKDWCAWLLVPSTALAAFGPAWTVLALSQPIGSLAFATDGVHWGTGDFRYLRNAMLVASVVCTAVVVAIEAAAPEDILVWIWLAMALWFTVRAGFGIIRIWPGIGDAPLKLKA